LAARSRRIAEGGEKDADGAQDLDQAVVQPEKDVADALWIEVSLGPAHHDGILVLELVLEDAPNRRSHGALPYRQFAGLA